MSLALRDPLCMPGPPTNLPVFLLDTRQPLRKVGANDKQAELGLGKERFFLQLSTSIQTCQSRGSTSRKKEVQR